MKAVSMKKKSTGFWEMLFSQAKLLLIIFDKNGKELLVSDSSETILGYKASEVIRKSVMEILCVDNRDYFRKSLKKMLRQQQKPMYVELLMQHRSGKQVIMGGHLLYTVEADNQNNICLLLRDLNYEKQIENKLNAVLDTYKKLNHYKVEAREKERQNIASALHDDIGQALTALKLELGLINDSLDNVATCQTRIDNMIKVIDEAALKTQRISYELRPLMLGNLSANTEIRQYCIEWGQRTGLTVNLSIDSVFLNYEKSLAIFRIVQEALTNVTRHANATSVKIDLLHTRDSLNLVIEDDGDGISEEKIGQQESYGIIGMRERAEMCNGTLFISGKNGTKVELVVPFNH